MIAELIQLGGLAVRYLLCITRQPSHLLLVLLCLRQGNGIA